MVEIISTVVSSVLAAVVTSGIVSVMGAYYFSRKQERWAMKKEACFEALNLADILISNYEYKNLPKDAIKKTECDDFTERARRCINNLVCVCDSPDVLNLFKTVMFESIRSDIVVDLRNSVRKELGFGRSIDQDRERAFVGKTIFDN